MISEIVSAINLGEHKLTPWGICIRSDFCQRHIRNLRGRGVPDNWRRKKQAKKARNSKTILVKSCNYYSFAGDIGSGLFIIRIPYRAILGRG